MLTIEKRANKVIIEFRKYSINWQNRVKKRWSTELLANKQALD